MDKIDNYELLDVIGQGKRTRLHRARDWSLKRSVAVKELVSDLGSSPAHAEQFWREAEFFAGAKHQNLVRVFGVNKERGWLIMELMDGSLSGLADKPLAGAAVRSVLQQGLSALAYLHEHGRIHGAVNPTNLLIDKDGKLCISDSSGAVDVGGVFQAPEKFKYLAPELLNPAFGATGPQVDLYCLGFVALELLVGPTFAQVFKIGEMNPDTDWARWHNSPEELPPIEKLVPGTPDDVAKVIGGLLRKRTADRYKTAKDAVKDLADAPLLSLKGGGAAAAEPEPQDAWSKIKRAYARQPLVCWPLTVLAVALLVMLPFMGTPVPETWPIKVSTDPPGATVTIDGDIKQDRTRKDFTTLTVKTGSKPGRHTLKVELPGYMPEDQEFTLDLKDETIVPQFSFKLTKKAAPPTVAAARSLRGTVTFEQAPPRALLFGQVKTLKPGFSLTETSPKTIGAEARIYWRLTGIKNASVRAEGFAKPEEVGAAVSQRAEQLRKDGQPQLRLHLGVGVPAPEFGTQSDTIIPLDADLSDFRIGFPLPNGVSYPAPDNRPDVADADGRWYATAWRGVDRTPVSVFFDAAGGNWWYVDQELVSVTKFLDLFLPEGKGAYLTAVNEVASTIPEEMTTYVGLAGLADPIRDTEPVNPKTADRAAEMMARGPALYDAAKIREADKWHRCYATPALAQERAVDALAVKADVPGGTTDRLPVIGISYVDARAYTLWLNDKTKAFWKLCDADRWAQVAPKSPATLPVRKFPWPVGGEAKVGNGPLGLWFVTGNLIEVGQNGGDNKVLMFGKHFTGREAPVGERPFVRSTHFGFRLHTTLRADQ